MPNELKTTAKQLRRLSTYEVRRVNQAANAAGDASLASAALAELRNRGR
jgi:hypothetical protein